MRLHVNPGVRLVKYVFEVFLERLPYYLPVGEVHEAGHVAHLLPALGHEMHRLQNLGGEVEPICRPLSPPPELQLHVGYSTKAFSKI